MFISYANVPFSDSRRVQNLFFIVSFGALTVETVMSQLLTHTVVHV